jgi:hypothetical protein
LDFRKFKQGGIIPVIRQAISTAGAVRGINQKLTAVRCDPKCGYRPANGAEEAICVCDFVRQL